MRAPLFVFTLLLPIFSFGAEDHPMLEGSVHTQAYENALADVFDLRRIESDAELKRLIREKKLVPLIRNENIRWHKGLKRKYAYVLPHMNEFIETYQREVVRAPIVITSAVRPKSYQKKLAKRNPNAAPTEGVVASTHPTGSTVDIGYKWKRKDAGYIRTLAESLVKEEAGGSLQATKENHQLCMHVMVPPDWKPKEVMKLAAR